MPSRFVILHHRVEGGEHWDLMLEHGEVLLTWQLSRMPAGPESFPVPAKRIGDHRKAYLTYEGPISGNRGTVRRVAEGEVQITAIDTTHLRFVLSHPTLTGEFVLMKDHSGGWVLDRT